MRPFDDVDLLLALVRLDLPSHTPPAEPNGFLLPGNFPPGWTPPSDDDDKPFLPSDDDGPWETTL
jgi:hypothetical protein